MHFQNQITFSHVILSVLEELLLAARMFALEAKYGFSILNSCCTYPCWERNTNDGNCHHFLFSFLCFKLLKCMQGFDKFTGFCITGQRHCMVWTPSSLSVLSFLFLVSVWEMIVSLRLFQCVYSINIKLNNFVLFPGINFHGSNHSLIISRILLCLVKFFCADNLNLLNLFMY